jgi:glyoxylate/hydroxypyruvate reductase A
MRILIYGADMRLEPWVADLRAALPTADVAEWTPGAAPADYAIVWAPPQRLIDEQPGLRAIFNLGAGVDPVMKLRLPAGLPVVRMEDAGMAVQMAEYVCHALIRYFRELDGYEHDMRARRWGVRKPRERKDWPVGILGLGVLGQRVARAVASFEFPVRGWSRTPRVMDGVECFAGPDQLDAFLAGTRVLVCLLPLTADTADILNRRTLGRLLPGAYLINIARGAHLVDDDLLAVLDSGHMAGATLDVFRTEPLPLDHPFWGDARITLTPHGAARTLREASVTQIVGKLVALERGEPVAGVVDPTRGY